MYEAVNQEHPNSVSNKSLSIAAKNICILSCGCGIATNTFLLLVRTFLILYVLN